MSCVYLNVYVCRSSRKTMTCPTSASASELRADRRSNLLERDPKRYITQCSSCDEPTTKALKVFHADRKCVTAARKKEVRIIFTEYSVVISDMSCSPWDSTSALVSHGCARGSLRSPHRAVILKNFLEFAFLFSSWSMLH